MKKTFEKMYMAQRFSFPILEKFNLEFLETIVFQRTLIVLNMGKQ